jgi:hypothetical protein
MARTSTSAKTTADKPMWRRYLRFWGADAPADIDSEISFHLEELAQRFGAVARVRAECVTAEERAVRASKRRDARYDLSQDARDAFRSLTRNRGFTVGAALILAPASTIGRGSIERGIRILKSCA